MQWVYIIGLTLLAQQSFASAKSPPDWVTAGPSLGDSATAFDVPIELLANKMYVQLELGGKQRRFVVDTGSPSMLDQALVEELGLAVVGESSGRDAHGTLIKSRIVQADLALGEVQFLRVPMFVADFASTPALKLFVGDGVLGSELLSLGAWQFDWPQARLRFNQDVSSLPHLDSAKSVPLSDFGYPHAPYFDVVFAKKAKSKALFDTGSPSYFAISDPDMKGSRAAGGLTSTWTGYGSAGASLGGSAPNTTLAKVGLKSLAISDLVLGATVAEVRGLSPSLLGAQLLEHFVITLHHPSKTAFFDAIESGAPALPVKPSGFGFGVAYKEVVYISAIWAGSPAAEAGLKVGDVITSVNGAAMSLDQANIRRLTTALAKEKLELVVNGKTVSIAKREFDAGAEHD